MNKPVAAKCYARILNDLSQFFFKMRRSRKLSCKNRGGVAREVSRRERDFPNTYSTIPTSSIFANSKPILCSPRLWQDLLGPLQEFDPIHWIFCIVREERARYLAKIRKFFRERFTIFEEEIYSLLHYFRVGRNPSKGSV